VPLRARTVTLGFAVLATLAPVAALALVGLGGIDPYTAGDAAALCIFAGIVGVLATPFLPTADRAPTRRERVLQLVVVWTWASTIAQLGWELPFVVLSRWLRGAGAGDHALFLWWTYGVADARYLLADPFVVFMEGVTALVGAPLEILALVLYYRGRLRPAALVAVIVAVTQLYGTVLYFGTEALAGFGHIDFGNPVNLWVKFIGLNALWLVMPAVVVFVGARTLLRAET
jgi:hypothetical protein